MTFSTHHLYAFQLLFRCGTTLSLCSDDLERFSKFNYRCTFSDNVSLHSKQYMLFRRNPSVQLPCNPALNCAGLHDDCTEGFFLKNLYCLECSYQVMFYVVLVCLFVCLYVCLSITGLRICVNVSPEVCLGPRNKQLHFVGDPDYDPYPRSGILFRSRWITI